MNKQKCILSYTSQKAGYAKHCMHVCQETALREFYEVDRCLLSFLYNVFRQSLIRRVFLHQG